MCFELEDLRRFRALGAEGLEPQSVSGGWVPGLGCRVGYDDSLILGGGWGGGGTVRIAAFPETPHASSSYRGLVEEGLTSKVVARLLVGFQEDNRLPCASIHSEP